MVGIPQSATEPPGETGSASERAYSDVKERILSGELAGGELISEGEVAELLAMSRTPVREAFLRLQAEGWMKLYPKRGAAIIPVKPEEADEVLQARVLIETHAVSVITDEPSRVGPLVAELKMIIERQRAAVDHDLTGFIDADADLHTAIVRAAGNGLLIDFYTGLRDRQRRMAGDSVRRGAADHDGPDKQQLILDQHHRLVELIAAGDADEFGVELRSHLNDIHRR
ncbi:GntR family transcriptional regulator [Microlunatus soli]|uniref:DNA-binding transcriptional regulator, GntR family n=1 Tax=Microlunatus soli TaxID=630515 RepID=A0A1H1MZY9_9ACTN|nr:GntR family transcriptional regulator [Microlunatus soli]SDR92188.1 DNA-binding transcriptional regulator, GntR family [Microlunatus soli]